MTEVSELPKKTYKILVADDEDDARNLIGIALGNDTNEIVFAKDGEETLRLYHEHNPDLLILDIQMPKISGLEVCERIKNQDGDNFVPILLLTSRQELDNKLEGLKIGADDYITKPFSLVELEARVKAFLRIKSLTDDLRATRELLHEKEKELLASEVAGTAAHELGQPLTSLLLHCRLLTTFSPDSQEYSESLSAITKESLRMKKIVDKLARLKRYSPVDYAAGLHILDLEDE
jgi:DNA-binding response OmpR family regulator